MVKQNSNPCAAGDASRLHEHLGNEVRVTQGRKAKSAAFFFLNISKSNEEYKREVPLPIAHIVTEANVCGFMFCVLKLLQSYVFLSEPVWLIFIKVVRITLLPVCQ